MPLIDLRSDTVTRPSAAMRRVMADAEVGDDVYGEDPTVRKLEESIAERLGLPAALFTPSGTQANQIAIGVHCRSGDELLTAEGSHCVQYEGGAASALWGVQPRLLASQRGLFSAELVRASVHPENIHHPRARLLALENTHNLGGGTVWKLEEFTQVVNAARAAGLKVHLDGARLFNAEVASGVSASRYASLTDSTSVCFSKGLGAPVGSALAGSKEFISEARRLRKRLGGGMRQAGLLAAAALYALEHNVARLEEDHQNASRLAREFSQIPGVEVDVARVETNLVYAELPGPAVTFVHRFKEEGVLVNAAGASPKMIRMVCHLDVSAKDIERTVQAARRVMGGSLR